MTSPLLRLNQIYVTSNGSTLLRDISFSIYPNEIVAIVGESGSGKSMLARTIMGLFPSDTISIASGSIFFRSMPLTEGQINGHRGHEIAYIPQSPLNALNPLMRVGKQIIETAKLSKNMSFDRALFLLKSVGFSDPKTIFYKYPYELSGGMRQRIVIAMGLMNMPALLIADEPTTALDVTLQADIIDLFLALKNTFNLSIMFITHDLALVAKIASRAIIIKDGEIIEEATVDDLFFSPKKGYTKKLLNSLLPNPFTQ